MKVLLLGGNGYIGSKFYKHTRHSVYSVDLCLFDKNLEYSHVINYNDGIQDIHRFDVIICLAGHSSVPMCEYSPNRSWLNNVEYFRTLCQNINANQRLIYASSASVYGRTSGVSTEKSDINFNVLNHYDLQKITIDLVANKYIAEGKNIIGLRFGTVNGVSPNTRSDLMINSMVKSSLDTKTVNVKNTHVRRAILGINDLCKSLEFLIENSITPGQYNLASFNSTVYQIADTVSQVTNAKIIEHPGDNLVYDFELSTDKFQQATGLVFTDTVESLIEGLYHSDSVNFDVRNNDRNFKYYISG